MENARLIAETRDARDTAEAALRDLRAAQASLIQAEKMASLGQPDAWFAGQQHHPALSGFGLLPAAAQQVEFLVTPDHRHGRRAQRLKSADRATLAENAPGQVAGP